MKIKKSKALKHLILLGLVITPAITTGSVILVQKLDKKYLLFDNKIFSSMKSLNNYLDKNKSSTFTKMNAKSYYFDNQIFNTDQQFHEYLTEKFNIDEKLTNKIPADYTINGAGELSRQVLLDETDQAVKVYRGKNGIAYQNRKEALDSFINYHKIYTFEGKEFNTAYEAQEYLQNSKLKELEADNSQKEVVYQNGGLMQSEAEIKTWLHQNLKNGFEYQGKIFSDYNYKEFLTYFQKLDDNLIDENITDVLNADKSAYWLNLDENIGQGYFIGPKYLETSTNLPNSVIESGWQTIDSFTPNLISGIASLSVFNKVVDLDYASKMQNEEDKDWNFTEKDGLKLYINKLATNEIISDELEKEINKLLFADESSPYLKQIVKDSVANLNKIDNQEFNDFHRLMVIMKRIMVPARIYSGINTVEIERVLKELIIQIVTKKTEFDKLFDLRINLENRKLEEIIDLFLNPEDFYQSNADKESTLAIIKKVDGVINTIMDGVKKINDLEGKLEKLQKKYQGQSKNSEELNTERGDFNEDTIDAILKKIDDVFKGFGINSEEEKSLSNSPFAIGVGSFLKWLSFGWEILNTFSFISIKTLEYKIDEYQSIYYVTPTFKTPIFNVEDAVKAPLIPVVKLSSSPLSYMLPRKTNDKNEVSKIYELEGKYYLKKENAIDELRSKIYLNPEKYIPCKIIFTSIFEKDEGYQLPDWLANAKIQKKASDLNKEGTISNSDYVKALEKEKDQYVDRLFASYFKSSEARYYLDGFGNYFSTKEEAVASLKKLVREQEIEKYSAYSYETRNGKRVIFKTEQEIQEFILQNELIDEKTIMSTDLIKTSIYDQISDYSDIYFSIYELDFYGDKKYFMSTVEVWTYLLNHLDYKTNYYKLNLEKYSYKDYEFMSENEFLSWIELNTQTLNSFQIEGKEVLSDE